jgi:hypothetical protein
VDNTQAGVAAVAVVVAGAVVEAQEPLADFENLPC